METKSREQKGELFYSEEFKELIRDNPGIISSFKKIEHEIKDKKWTSELFYGDIFQDGDLSITIINKHGEEKSGTNANHYYMKARVGEKTFFIKSIPGMFATDPEKSKGAKEFYSLQTAKERLVGIEGVEVVNFQLGYEDKKGRTYFVSEWKDGIILELYLQALEKKTDVEAKTEHDRLSKKILEIKGVLGDKFEDVGGHNMLYDQKTDTIIIFDIHLKE